MNIFFNCNPEYHYYQNFGEHILAVFNKNFGFFCHSIFYAALNLVAVCVEDKQTYTGTVQQKDELTQNLAQLRNKVVTSLLDLGIIERSV